MTIPTLPTAPARTMSQDTFDAAVEAWIAALDTWTTAVNALGITTITGSIQSTPIGNVTPSTGAVTTLSVNGELSFATDNAYDIGATNVNRPKDVFIAGTYASQIADSDTVWNVPVAINLGASYIKCRIGTDKSLNVDTYNGGSYVNAVKIPQVGGLAVTGSISATTTIRSGGYIVATLPAGASGDRAHVTDA